MAKPEWLLTDRGRHRPTDGTARGERARPGYPEGCDWARTEGTCSLCRAWADTAQPIV